MRWIRFAWGVVLLILIGFGLLIGFWKDISQFLIAHPDVPTRVIHWLVALGLGLILTGSALQAQAALASYDRLLRELGLTDLAKRIPLPPIASAAVGNLLVNPFRPVRDLVMFIRDLVMFIGDGHRVYRNLRQLYREKNPRAVELTQAMKLAAVWAMILLGSFLLLVAAAMQLVLDYAL
jgi:hypothetical protein